MMKNFQQFKKQSKKSYWTRKRKPEVLKNLDKAGVTGDARKQILKFERRINTLLNKLMRGQSWEAVSYSKAREDADIMFTLEFDRGEKYHDQWIKYCDASGYNRGANVGDFLA